MDWNNKESVLSFVKDFGVLMYASDDLKNNKDLALEIVDIDVHLLKEISRRVRADKDFIIKAIEKNAMSLIYAPVDIQFDRDILMAIEDTDIFKNKIIFGEHRRILDVYKREDKLFSLLQEEKKLNNFKSKRKI